MGTYFNEFWIGINTLRPIKICCNFAMTFSHACSWMKIYQFHLRFHWSLFLRLELTIFQHWFNIGSLSAMMVSLLMHISVIGPQWHFNDVIMGMIASQITSLTIVYSTVYSDADQRKLQNSASLAFVRGIHQGPVNFPHKWPVTWKMFPFDDVIMELNNFHSRIVIWNIICWIAATLSHPQYVNRLVCTMNGR